MKFLRNAINNNYIILLLITVLVFICYGVALNAAFLIDDNAGIVNNPDLRSLSWLLSRGISIFAFLPFYLSLKIGGLIPFAFRIVNICFHIGTTFLLFLILKKLSNRTIALTSAILVAIHPIFIESVTWISALSYAQYSFFVLLAIVGYIYGRESNRWYLMSIVATILSILSSEKAISIFPILVLLEFTYHSIKKNWKKIIPHFLILASVASFHLLNIGHRIDNFQKDFYIQKQYYNPVEHVPYAVTYYIQLILFPNDLTVYHSELSITIVEFLLRWLFFIIFIVSIVSTYKKNKIYFFWACFYLVALAPTLIPLNIVWVVAERYAYLGSIGVMVLLGYGLSQLIENKKTTTLAATLSTVIFIGLVGRSIVRNSDWISGETLWPSTIAVSPHSSNAHNNMGDVYAKRNDYVSAAREFQRAIELQPGDADPRHNLGIAFTVLKKYPEAIDAYQGALQIKPTLYKTHQNLGIVYYYVKNMKESEYHLSKALEYGPPNPDVLKLLNEVKKLQE